MGWGCQAVMTSSARTCLVRPRMPGGVAEVQPIMADPCADLFTALLQHHPRSA